MARYSTRYFNETEGVTLSGEYAYHAYQVVDAYALADDSSTVHQQGVLTYKLLAI